MNIKLVTSVSALAFGLALSGAAMAQSAGADEGNAAAAANGSIATAFDISALNGNTLDSSSNDDNSVDVSGLNNNDLSTNMDNSVDVSGLNNNDLSTNTDNSLDVSGFNNNDLSTNTDSSVNTDSSIDVSGLNGNSVNSNNATDSYNTDNSTTTTNLNLRVNLSTQDLGANVSNISFTGGDQGDGSDSRSLETGAISLSGNAMQGFGGINTSSNNSGFGSAGQASTMVSANANVTFQ